MFDFRRMGATLFPQQEQNAGETIQGTRRSIDKMDTVYMFA